MSPATHSDKLQGLALVAVALASGFVLCVASVGLIQLWPPTALVEHGCLTRLCVSAKLGGQSRVASWVSPAISTRTNHIRYPSIQGSSLCGFAPWDPHLPTNAT